jgi:hypothetical protein
VTDQLSEQQPVLPDDLRESIERLNNALAHLGQMAQEIFAAYAPIFEQIAESLHKAVADVTDVMEATRMPDRPAWQAPYGPPQKRARQ